MKLLLLLNIIIIMLSSFSCAVEPTETYSTEWIIEPFPCPMYIYATNTPIQITSNTIYIYSNKVKITAISSCNSDFLQKFLKGPFWFWFIPEPGIINLYRDGEWLISSEIITYENL